VAYSQRTFCKIDQRDVAVNKYAVGKDSFIKADMGKIAIFESTLFELFGFREVL